MDRRRAILAIGCLAAGAPTPQTFAQRRSGVWRIGFLSAEPPEAYLGRLDTFRSTLRSLGYSEETNFVIEVRSANGRYGQLRGLADELVQLKVDVLVAGGNKAAVAAKEATATIPLVVVVGDAIATGLVTSLAHPGGNVTGVSILSPDLQRKQLSLLKEALPAINHVALLLNPENNLANQTREDLLRVATGLKIRLRSVPINELAELDGAITAIAKAGDKAVILQNDTFFYANAKRIADRALKSGLVVVGSAEVAKAGGVLGYGVDPVEAFRRSAGYVDKIFKGEKPGDLPIEQASQYRLVVNLLAARKLAIKVRPVILERADEVVQ